MNTSQFFSKYFKTIERKISSIDIIQLEQFAEIALKTHYAGKKIIIFGNGGSAAMASHVAVDFTKAAGIRAMNFNEADLITCFANDYGYENWVAKAFEAYADSGDLAILISSSGKSDNIIKAAQYCKENNYDLITFSGFDRNNDLCKLGKINFFIDSKNYNYVEMSHHIILVSIVDIFAQKNL